MSDKLLLCTDLDRTLLPNGMQTEPARARCRFAHLASHPDVILAYVSGRDKGLMQRAIDEFSIPTPDFAITDVGATLYKVQDGEWCAISDWTRRITGDWVGMSSWQVRDAINYTGKLVLQPESKQGQYKLSYELHPADRLLPETELLEQALKALNIAYNCVVSIDETKNIGLVDILPESANKRLAIEFLQQYLAVDHGNLMFSGDSGNDLDVMLSPIQSTLVANATGEVKAQATQLLADHLGESLYFSEQVYAAGIIEGFLHYFPQLSNWMTADDRHA